MELDIQERAYLVDLLRQRVVQEEAWMLAQHTTVEERRECMKRREAALRLVVKFDQS